MANPFKSSVILIMCQRKDNSVILSLPIAKLKMTESNKIDIIIVLTSFK